MGSVMGEGCVEVRAYWHGDATAVVDLVLSIQREEFGMAVSGGPVRVAPGTGEPEVIEPEAEPSKGEKAAPDVARPDQASIELHLDWE